MNLLFQISPKVFCCCQTIFQLRTTLRQYGVVSDFKSSNGCSDGDLFCLQIGEHLGGWHISIFVSSLGSPTLPLRFHHAPYDFVHTLIQSRASLRLDHASAWLDEKGCNGPLGCDSYFVCLPVANAR